MRKILCAAMVIAATTIGSSAQAGEPTDPFIVLRQADAESTAKSIAKVEETYVAFCKYTTVEVEDYAACEALYKMIIASARKDLAVIIAQIAAVRTSPKNSVALYKIVPMKEFNEEGAITTRRVKQIATFFRELRAARLSTMGVKP